MLNNELIYWKEKLGLQNWSIDVTYTDDIKYEGTSVSSPLIKAARIAIANPTKVEKEKKIEFDVEQILVHEMLHILFSNIEDDIEANCEEKTYELFHTYVDDLAKALVSTKKNCHPTELYKLL